jgi:multidrug efflux system membrane fusion protein
MSQPPLEPYRPKPLTQVPTAAEKKKNRTAVLLSLIAVFVLGTGGLLYYRSKTPQPSAFPGGGGRGPGGPGGGGGGGGGRRGGFGMTGPLPVVVNPVRKGDINIVLPGLGAVTPLATVTVRTQISGYLTRINFTEDQLVKQGDVLAVIDSRPYAAALEQAQGQLLQAQAQFQEATIDLERYVTLSGQDSISKQQVDAQRALVSQYQGMVKQNQGVVDNAQLNLSYCNVTAPISGRVGLRLVDQGNYVTPGDATGLVILAQVTPITVIFSIPEDYIPQVLKQVRTPGTVVPVYAYNRDNTVKLATGVLTSIDNTVDPTTGTFKLRATFSNDDEALFPSQFVNVSVLIDVVKGATVVSTSAIERGQQGTFVYVVGADNKVLATTVTLGATEGERVAVLTGLKPGDRVVVDGADRLKDGMEVDPQLPNAQGGGKGGGGGHNWNRGGKPGADGKPSAEGTPAADGKPGAPDAEHKHWKKPDSN